MNVLKLFSVCWVVLFALFSCEQEDAIQRPLSSAADPQLDAAVKSKTPTRNFEVLDLNAVDSRQNGYHRLQQNKATGSVLYAHTKKGQKASYMILKRNGRQIAYTASDPDGKCPDLYICIDPKTDKYIFYDKCKTDNPCGRPTCSELVWCIDPDTGDYKLYDKCQTDNPCQKDTPPIFSVSKNQQVQPFCPLVEYTWMIDPETGEYMLLTECNNVTQMFLPVGW